MVSGSQRMLRSSLCSSLFETRPDPIRARTAAALAASFFLVACTKATTPGPFDAAPTHDAGTDARVPFDASGLACYPVTYTYFMGPHQLLEVGLLTYCDEFGFFASDAEAAEAETLIGSTCSPASTGVMCTTSRPQSWTVAASDYTEICDIVDALGPRTWYCLVYE